MRRKGLLKSVVWLTLLSLVLLLFVLGTSAANEGNYYYKVENGEAIITDCKVSSSGEITIPTTLGGYPVKAIESSAFAACTFLTEVTVPSCIESIGDYAFLGCTRLETVNVEGATAIGDYAFRGCTSLNNVKLASDVSQIGEHAFYSCNSIENVYVSDLAAWCGISFADEYSNPLYYAENLYVDETLTTDVVLPEGVTAISAYAFSSYSLQLNSFDIPESVESVGKSAFEGCDTVINNVGGVSYVDNWVVDCASDTALILLADTTVGIADYALSSCTAFTGIEIPASVKYVGDYAFKYCSSLSDVTFANGLVSIGDYAFYACHNIGNVAFPDSLESIGEYAFAGYHKMTAVSIPKNVSSIGKRAFNVNGIAKISVAEENSVYRSESNCIIEKATNTLILGCDGSVIPSSAVKIADGAFAYSFINSIYIPAGVTLIENGAFDFAYGLSEIVVDVNNAVYASVGNCLIEKATNTLVLGCKNSLIPNDGSVTVIGENAFLGCLELMNAEIPSCVTEIREGAFELCQNLAHMRIFSEDCVIFDSEDTICDAATIYGYAGSSAEAYAKKYGRSFETIPEGQDENIIFGRFGVDGKLSYLLNKQTESLTVSGEGKIPDYAPNSKSPWYPYRSVIKEVVVSDGITRIGDFAFYGCDVLTDIAIPSSVKTIGDAAFASCSSLAEITVPASVERLGISEYTDDGFALEEYYGLFVKNGLIYHLNFASATEGTPIIGGVDYYDEDVVASKRFNGAASNYTKYLAYCRNNIADPVLGGTATILHPYKFVSPYKYSYWFDEDGNRLNSGGNGEDPENFVTVTPSSLGFTAYAPNGTPSTSKRTMKETEYTLYNCVYQAPVTATNYYISEGVWGVPRYSSEFGNGYLDARSGNDIKIYDGGVSALLSSSAEFSIELTAAATGSPMKGAAFFIGPRLEFIPNAEYVNFIGSNDYEMLAKESGYTDIRMPVSGSAINTYSFTFDLENIAEYSYVLNAYGNGTNYSDQTLKSKTNTFASQGQYQMRGDDLNTYAIRVYSKELTANEVLQNHFADIALINRLDITKFLRLTDEEKLVVYQAFKGKAIESDKAELQAILDANCDISDKIYGLFADCGFLEKITVLSTDCVILDTGLGLDETTLIYAYDGSSAEAYAYAHGNVFCDLEKNTDENIIVGEFENNGHFTFTLNKTTGELTVSGEGDLPDYSASSHAPWYPLRAYVKTLTVSEGITGIGSYAFHSCNLLSQTDLPDSLVSISSYAFSQCNALGDIIIPKNVQTVDARAFNSNFISSITVEDGNAYYTASGNCLIETASNTLVLGCADSVIPADGSVTSIGDYAFYGCSGIDAIEIPENVTEIGAYAFALCTSVAELTLPGTLTDIGANAFSDCSALSTVTVLALDPPAVESGAFARCGSLSKIRIQFVSVDKYKAADFWSGYSDMLVLICNHVYTDTVAPAYFKEAANGVGIYYKSCDICEASAKDESSELTFECIYGDASGDGKANGRDIVLMRQYLANFDYDTNSSSVAVHIGIDANGDGEVDLKDLMLLREYMAYYDYQTDTPKFWLGPDVQE